MSNLLVDFSLDPPSKILMAKILQGVGWDSEDAAVNTMVAHRPHPSLTSLWATLLQGGVMVGMATLYLPPPESLVNAPVFIGNFVVDGSTQHIGLGSFMLARIEEWCKQMQVRQLALQTIETSTPFFMAKGFVRHNPQSGIFIKLLA